MTGSGQDKDGRDRRSFDELLDEHRPVGTLGDDARFVSDGGLLGVHPRSPDSCEAQDEQRVNFYTQRPFVVFEAALNARREATASRPAEQRVVSLDAKRRTPWPVATAWLAAAAAVAALAWWLAPLALPPVANLGGTAGPEHRWSGAVNHQSTIRTKGTVPGADRQTGATQPLAAPRTSELHVWRVAGPAREPVLPGAELTEGDRLEFAYDAIGWSYVYVASIDAQGTVSAYYPADGARSLAIAPGIGLPLPGAVELDDFVGAEMLVAIFSAQAVTEETVREALTSQQERSRGHGSMQPTRTLDIPVEHEVRTVAFTKVPVQGSRQ